MTPKIAVVKVALHGYVHEMSVKMMLGCDYRPMLEFADGPFVAVDFK